MLRAFYDLVNESRSNFLQPQEADVNKVIETFIWEKELTFDLGFFDNPTQSPLVGEMRLFLADWLENCGFTSKNEEFRSLGGSHPISFLHSMMSGGQGEPPINRLLSFSTYLS